MYKRQELDGGERYWFSAEEEAELQLRNREFYAMPVEQEVFYRCFRLPEAGEEFKLYSASVIFTILQSRYPAAMRGMTVVRFGKMMSAMGAERMHTEKGNLYKVVLAA